MDKQILPLYKDISRNGVTVPADVQSLTIAFVAPDYINGENYEYSYQLVNYNSSWEKLQNDKQGNFHEPTVRGIFAESPLSQRCH